jgi:geranylgeranyl diphosphate synthase type II
MRLGLSKSDAICAASVCELLHNASLIQDDLLDRTTVRRGSPSVWDKHGDTIAVCTGDLMLSAAYGLLCELGRPTLIAPALRLVHRRTSEVILGQAAESVAQQSGLEGTTAHYQRVAKAKSASLLSLSLELPLLLSGNEACLADAHEAASDFAVAYQIADDLEDVAQDTQERPSNLLLLLEADGLAKPEAYTCAIELAAAHLAYAGKGARGLPNDCAARLLVHAEELRRTLAGYSITSLATAGG